MRIFKYIILIVLAILAWASIIVYGGIMKGMLLTKLNADDSPESFIEATKQKAKEDFVGNLALVLIENGTRSKSYYYSNDKPIDQTSVFQVASVSKWVTSWGIHKLVEQGKIDLDTPIDHYLTRWHLPETDFDNTKVTVRRLLSHSSGLVDGLGYMGFGPNEHVQTIEESLTKASDAYSTDGVVKVGYEPGTQFQYSGGGYTILQLLIEEVSGVSFQEYMTKTVFEPLDMQHSTFVLSEKPNLKLAQLYAEDGSISEPYTFTALAAASLYTCTEDLSKFMLANLGNNKVLSTTTVKQMTQPESFVNGMGFYGMGPRLFSQNDLKSNVIGHDGFSLRPLINTSVRVDLNSKNGIIILEMGNYNIATALADEWLYWKTDIADYVVIMRNKTRLISIFSIGCLLILIFSIRWIRKQNITRKMLA